jgi:hypothetical protein
MSSIVVTPKTRPEQGGSVFTATGRWVAAGVVVAGGLLQALEFLFESPNDDNAARLAYWSEHASRIGLSQACGLVAVAFLVGSIVVWVALTRGRSPRLAWTAGALLTAGMVGLAAVHGVELAAYVALRNGERAGALAILNGSNAGIGGAVLLAMFLGGGALGMLALIVALWRSPLVPRVVPGFVLAFIILDLAVGWGTVAHLVQLVGDVILAVAIVTGYSRAARHSDDAARPGGPQAARQGGPEAARQGGPEAARQGGE